ncbi:MAG: branched-chain amino acid ABC transporter permease [Sulfolobales archaeon]
MDTVMFLQIFVNAMLLGGMYAIISIGLNIIFGVLKIVNFAHGELIMLGMYISYWLAVIYGLNPYLTLPLTALALLLIGAGIERILIKPILNAPSINQLLTTAALILIIQNVALILWRADYRGVTVRMPLISIGPIFVSGTRLVAFVGGIAASLILYYILMRTDTGIRIRAVAQDPEVSQILGVNVPRIQTLTFCLGSLLAGIAGSLMIPIFMVNPTVGGGFGLIAWVIIVLGGLGSFTGALIGSFIVGLIEAYVGVLISLEVARAVAFFAFILILLFRPSGILGEKARV